MTDVLDPESDSEGMYQLLATIGMVKVECMCSLKLTKLLRAKISEQGHSVKQSIHFAEGE
jgi:hypothetical protein